MEEGVAFNSTQENKVQKLNSHADLVAHLLYALKEFNKHRMIIIRDIPNVTYQDVKLFMGRFAVSNIAISQKLRHAIVELRDGSECEEAVLSLSGKSLCGCSVRVSLYRNDNLLCVTHLSKSTQEQEFRALLEPFGVIEKCFLMRDITGMSKGYGFVLFAHNRDKSETARCGIERVNDPRCTGPALALRSEFVKPSLVTFESLHSSCLYVDCLPPGYEDCEELRLVFSVMAPPTFCRVSSLSNPPYLSFALVEFSSSVLAEQTFLKRQGHMIRGQPIRMFFCVPGQSASEEYARYISIAEGKSYTPHAAPACTLPPTLVTNQTNSLISPDVINLMAQNPNVLKSFQAFLEQVELVQNQNLVKNLPSVPAQSLQSVTPLNGQQFQVQRSQQPLDYQMQSSLVPLTASHPNAMLQQGTLLCNNMVQSRRRSQENALVQPHPLNSIENAPVQCQTVNSAPGVGLQNNQMFDLMLSLCAKVNTSGNPNGVRCVPEMFNRNQQNQTSSIPHVKPDLSMAVPPQCNQISGHLTNYNSNFNFPNHGSNTGVQISTVTVPISTVTNANVVVDQKVSSNRMNQSVLIDHYAANQSKGVVPDVKGDITSSKPAIRLPPGLPIPSMNAGHMQGESQAINRTKQNVEAKGAEGQTVVVSQAQLVSQHANSWVQPSNPPNAVGDLKWDFNFNQKSAIPSFQAINVTSTASYGTKSLSTTIDMNPPAFENLFRVPLVSSAAVSVVSSAIDEVTSNTKGITEYTVNQKVMTDLQDEFVLPGLDSTDDAENVENRSDNSDIVSPRPFVKKGQNGMWTTSTIRDPLTIIKCLDKPGGVPAPIGSKPSSNNTVQQASTPRTGLKRKRAHFVPSPEKTPEGPYIGQHSQGLGGHYADSFDVIKKFRLTTDSD